MRGAAVLALLAVLIAAAPAQAVTYFVRVGGNDANRGRSPDDAFATIGRAAAVAGGEDTVEVGPGRYAEGNITPRGGGLRREMVRFTADVEGTRTGDPRGAVVVDASGFDVGFRLASRTWVVINGFTVTGALEEGISVKSGSDHTVVANCIVFSNGGRGVWVRDSEDTIVFNNLIYANGGTGIDFGGERGGSSGGVAVGNTVYGNGLDGIRVEGVVPSTGMTVIANLIAQNVGSGVNLKTRSADDFVGQWNVNVDGYGSEAEAAAVDFDESPLLVAPSGGDRILGGPGHLDDDFRLRQLAAGQREESPAVDGSALTVRWLDLDRSSTRSDGQPDAGTLDIGYHYGNKSDLVSGLRRVEKRLRSLRVRAGKCQRAASRIRGGSAFCALGKNARRSLRKQCGPGIERGCS